jgi:hypothetical protein
MTGGLDECGTLEGVGWYMVLSNRVGRMSLEDLPQGLKPRSVSGRFESQG